MCLKANKTNSLDKLVQQKFDRAKETHSKPHILVKLKAAC